MLAMPAPMIAPPIGARQRPGELAEKEKPQDVNIIAAASDSAVNATPYPVETPGS